MDVARSLLGSDGGTRQAIMTNPIPKRLRVGNCYLMAVLAYDSIKFPKRHLCEALFFRGARLSECDQFYLRFAVATIASCYD